MINELQKIEPELLREFFAIAATALNDVSTVQMISEEQNIPVSKLMAYCQFANELGSANMAITSFSELNEVEAEVKKYTDF